MQSWGRSREVEKVKKPKPQPAAETDAPMHVFESGAKRSELKPRYDLIPSVLLERLALRYTIGAEKYGEWNAVAVFHQVVDDVVERVVECAMQRCDQAALVRLLVAKGVITKQEYRDAVVEEMRREVKRYEDRPSEHYGRPITLGLAE